MKHGDGAQHIGDLIRDHNIVLRGADALSQRGFTQVPNHVLRSGSISPGAKLAYAMLLSYAWQNDFCFPGQQRLAKDMGAGIRSVVRYIQELEKQQFVAIRKRGQGRPNLYELNLTASHVTGGAARSANLAPLDVPHLHPKTRSFGTLRRLREKNKEKNTV